VVRWRRRTVEPIDVLVVCTGNLCRSPLIETLLRSELPDLRIESRGTHAPVGEPWHPLALEVLAERGHVVTGQAQQLTARDVKAATLVLTAEGWHRAEVVRLDAAAEERVFTLLEAVRLLPDDRSGILPIDQLGRLLATQLSEQRSEYNDDIADPLSGPLGTFRECLQNINRAVLALARTAR